MEQDGELGKDSRICARVAGMGIDCAVLECRADLDGPRA